MIAHSLLCFCAGAWLVLAAPQHVPIRGRTEGNCITLPDSCLVFNALGLASASPVQKAKADPSTTSPATTFLLRLLSNPDIPDTTCTFTDASAAIASATACATVILDGIDVPAGTTLSLKELTEGTTVIFEGETTFGYEEWTGPLIEFSGTDITIEGASGHVIDGGGAQWWDGEGSNGGKTKPEFFWAHNLIDSIMIGLNVLNTPVQGFSVDGCTNVRIQDITINDSEGTTDGLGHNTDCFDIGESTGVYLSGIICENQDDCIAINSGTNITFTNGTCSGGHGLSIGSVGGRSDNTVENIYIESSIISNSQNGVRIKCNAGTDGSVTNVTYSGITLSSITDYGIVIEQDYENGSPTGTPTGGVPITELTLDDISGSVEEDATPYYILCAACSNWTVASVNITGGSEDISECEGVPSAASALC